MRTYGPPTYEEALDQAVRLMSGWGSWEEMRANLTVCNHSYAPTLRDDDAAAPLPHHKQAIAMMREACDRAGFRYYDGSQLHNDKAPLSRIARTLPHSRRRAAGGAR